MECYLDRLRKRLDFIVCLETTEEEKEEREKLHERDATESPND